MAARTITPEEATQALYVAVARAMNVHGAGMDICNVNNTVLTALIQANLNLDRNLETAVDHVASHLADVAEYFEDHDIPAQELPTQRAN